MKVLDRFMSALGYVPRSEVIASVSSLQIDVDSSQVDAAIAKLAVLDRAAVKAQAAMNSAAALADFGANDLCAEPARDLLTAKFDAQRGHIDKVLKMLEAQHFEIVKNAMRTDEILRTLDAAAVADASGLPG